MLTRMSVCESKQPFSWTDIITLWRSILNVPSDRVHAQPVGSDWQLDLATTCCEEEFAL